MIELMVGIAIVSSIATIAIPAFQHFVSKARQSEAKIALSAIYSTQKIFMTENQHYTQCNWEAGYQPSSGSVRHYMTGSWGAGIEWIDPQTGSDCMLNYIAFGTSSRNDSTFMPTDPTFTPPLGQSDWGAFPTHFKMVAIGNITGDHSLYDIWSIDQDKNLVNVQPGF